MDERVTVEILKCANGHDVMAVSIGGRRITGSKCCGHWRTVRSYRVRRAALLEDVTEAVAT